MKNLFKHPLNLIVALTCITVMIYFGIKAYKEIRPQRDKKYDVELKNIRRDDQSISTSNTDDVNNRLDEIQNNQERFSREMQLRNDCESSGGEYQGSGTCVYR